MLPYYSGIDAALLRMLISSLIIIGAIIDYNKFETARIIGARALQLAYGAPPLVTVPTGMSNPLDLAKLEFSEGVIPIVVVRK